MGRGSGNYAERGWGEGVGERGVNSSGEGCWGERGII